MRFGFFDQLPCPPGYSEQQRYRDILAQIELGDRVGFDTVWLGELHFSRGFSILADPLMVLAAAAQRTSRIRLGTAVTLLPMHNPVKIAEEAAICDILSNGRLELGVGRGTAPLHYAGYNIPMEESRERFDEALDFLIGAWTHESFSFEGKYFRAQNLSVVPRPLQSPHPKLRIAANSPDTFPFAARRRFPIFATPMINPPDKLKAGLGVYREGLGGNPCDTALAFPVHVSASREAARAECEPGLMRFMHEAAARLRPLGDHDVKSFEAFRQVLERMDRVTFSDIDREMGRVRRPGLLRRAGARIAPRLRHGRVHLLFQPGRADGPGPGQGNHDLVRQGGHAALPLRRAGNGAGKSARGGSPGRRRSTMKNGYRVYDSDTHVLPAAEVIERYVDPDFRPRLAELEQYRVPVRQSAEHSGGTHSYRVAQQYYPRVLGEAAPREDHTGRETKWRGSKLPRPGRPG